MRFSALVPSTLLVASCTMSGTLPAEITDNAKINKYDLTIADDDGACVARSLSARGAVDFALSPKPPCHFLRRDGKVQAFSYGEEAPKTVVIVAGTPISEETRREWGLDSKLVCGEEIQGILLSNAGVSVSKGMLSGGVWCRDKGTDEKDFWQFGHEEVQ